MNIVKHKGILYISRYQLNNMVIGSFMQAISNSPNQTVYQARKWLLTSFITQSPNPNQLSLQISVETNAPQSSLDKTEALKKPVKP